jgi:uncharacterized protein (DUF433 family)
VVAGGVVGEEVADLRESGWRGRAFLDVTSTHSGGMDYREIITVEAGKRGGKPCLRGLRVTVYDVLDYLAAGMSHGQMLEEFPYLKEEDIRACLAYAADRERRLVVAVG